jgi:flagellar biosynthesis component FlhA
MNSTISPKKTLPILFIAVLLAITPSCKTKEAVSKEVKQAEKIQDEQNKEAHKEYENAVKEHQKKQSDYAKQLMKDMKRKQKKNNLVRKRSLWDQIFRRNCTKPR